MTTHSDKQVARKAQSSEGAWLLDFTVAIKLPVGEMAVKLHNGPFDSRAEALMWHSKVKQKLAGKRVTLKRWEVSDGVSRGLARTYDVATLTGDPRVNWVRRSLFVHRKKDECLTRGMAVLSTMDADEVARNMRSIVLERIESYLSH